jgi:UDP-N-acetylmuramyl pentapeptide phosphotransferase/UDP-N-acetylglucosamine-1-phosphate transferase
MYVALGLFGAAVTLCGLIWLSNLYNFMDGMDGLAASQTIIAALTLAVWSLQLGDYGLTILLLVLAAASYGFLLHNWHPASIFMGDVGSTTIGAFFGTVIVILNVRYGVPVLALVMVFAVFVLDATVTLLRRVVRGEPFWLPHRSHYYQRLAALGLNHSKIVLIYIVLMLFCSMLATLAATGHARIPITCLCVVGVLGAGMALVTRLEASRG